MRKASLILLAALALSACAQQAERVTFDGVYFPAKSKKASEDRQDFVVTVRKADRNPKLALEAARYEGKQYCLRNFGTSNIAWARDVATEGGTVAVSNGRISLGGRCIIW